MHNVVLTNKQKMQVTQILTELVTIPTVNAKDHRTYQVIPPIIRKFADGSRLSQGCRLCHRTVRHGMDPQQTNIRLCVGNIIEDEDKQNGSVGLHLQHQVKASMKNDAYQVQLAFSTSDLIACRCTCRAGSMGTEKIVCVHILPVLFQIGQLMFQGMSEQILIESSNLFSGSGLMIHDEE
jgi:SWIM zinc finger